MTAGPSPARIVSSASCVARRTASGSMPSTFHAWDAEALSTDRQPVVSHDLFDVGRHGVEVVLDEEGDRKLPRGGKVEAFRARSRSGLSHLRNRRWSRRSCPRASAPRRCPQRRARRRRRSRLFRAPRPPAIAGASSRRAPRRTPAPARESRRESAAAACWTTGGTGSSRVRYAGSDVCRAPWRGTGDDHDGTRPRHRSSAVR